MTSPIPFIIPRKKDKEETKKEKEERKRKEINDRVLADLKKGKKI